MDFIVGLLGDAHLPISDIRNPEIQFLVTEESGSLIGVCGVEKAGNSLLLRSLAVRADRRGEGIGKALVSQALQNAKQQGFGSVFLLTTTAAEFFRKYGFRTLERNAIPTEIQNTQQFKSICPVSATCMVYSLEEK